MKVRAVTRRYRSSCRVDPSRSDADGFQLLESVKVVAKRALGAIKLETDSEESTIAWHCGKSSANAAKRRAPPRLDFCASRFVFEPRATIHHPATNQHRQDALQQTHLRTSCRHAEPRNFDILTFFAAPQATVSQHRNFAQYQRHDPLPNDRSKYSLRSLYHSPKTAKSYSRSRRKQKR